jgi:hypothetical protein
MPENKSLAAVREHVVPETRSWLASEALTWAKGYVVIYGTPLVGAAGIFLWTYVASWSGPAIALAVGVATSVGLAIPAEWRRRKAGVAAERAAMAKEQYFIAAKQVLLEGKAVPAIEAARLIPDGPPPVLTTVEYVGQQLDILVSNSGGDAVVVAEGEILAVKGDARKRASPFKMVWVDPDNHSVGGNQRLIKSGGKCLLRVASVDLSSAIGSAHFFIRVHGDKNTVDTYSCNHRAVSVAMRVAISTRPESTPIVRELKFRNEQNELLLVMMKEPPKP